MKSRLQGSIAVLISEWNAVVVDDDDELLATQVKYYSWH